MFYDPAPVPPPDSGTPGLPASAAPTAACSLSPDKMHIAKPLASSPVDTLVGLRPSKPPRTGGDQTAPPWHAAENISARPPEHPSHLAAANKLAPDRKQKIATCLLC